MSTHNNDRRFLNKGQAGRLLGLTINEMKALKKMGKGPAFVGGSEYFVYPAHAVHAWAMYNVHAPTMWFDRFLCSDFKDVTRTRIERNTTTGKYHISEYEEARLLLKMVHDEDYNLGNGLYLLYLYDDAEECEECVLDLLRENQTIPAVRSLILENNKVNTQK